MSLNASAPITAIAAMLTATAGVQAVYTGVPESMSHRLSAFVAMAGQRIRDKATGLLEREARYTVGLGYRVKGAEAAAELALAAAADAFTLAFYADRDLGGSVLSASLGETGSDAPLYYDIGGEEYRVFPMLIITTQHQTYDNRQ